MIQDYLSKVEQGKNLSAAETAMVMELIISGYAPKEEIKKFLLALNKKGPTVEEITASALTLQKFALPIKSRHQKVLDVVGTGGDQKNTFNISTVTAIVVAACGVIVAKHGNRKVSSQCGSVDVLDALGINVHINEKYLSEALDNIGLVFLFAQRLHPAMKIVAPVRQELGVRTIFNILGPLTNPAQATHQLMGVYSKDLVEPLCQVLKNLGLKRAMVVHGNDGLDEITTTDKTFVSEFNGQEIKSYEIDPDQWGITRAKIGDLSGGDANDNASLIKRILDGETGARRDITVLNSAYALYTAGAVDDVASGLRMAEKAIDSGDAMKKLEQLKEFTKRVQ